MPPIRLRHGILPSIALPSGDGIHLAFSVADGYDPSDVPSWSVRIGGKYSGVQWKSDSAVSVSGQQIVIEADMTDESSDDSSVTLADATESGRCFISLTAHAADGDWRVQGAIDFVGDDDLPIGSTDAGVPVVVSLTDADTLTMTLVTGADGTSSYTYIGYAADNVGTGFSTTPGPTRDYVAFLTSTEEIETPAAGDFAGLWQQYKGGEGTGDVVGPASSTANHVVLFDGTSGKLIKSAGVALGDAAAKNTGTTAGTVAAGDHSHAQLHDAATVSGNGISISGQQISLSIGTGATQVAAGDHTHAQLHDAVTVADSTSIDLTLSGQQISAAAIFGTTSGTVCQGNDARLSDSRTPTSHASSHVTGGSDKIRDASASQDGLMTSAQASKLDGIAAGANNYTLPVATTTTIGGVKRNTGSAGQYVSGIDSDGALQYGTPSGGGGSGDVVGPASSVDNQVARFDGSTGKLIQSSSVRITDEGNIIEVARVAGVTKGGGGGWFEANGGLSSISPDTGIGGAAGSIIMNGSDASVDTNGAAGGAVFTFATGVNAGGNFYAQGGTNAPGGDVNTSDGGGAINTRGTGVIELGQTGTRTTIEGTATENRAIDFPDESGTLVIGPVTAAKMSAGAAADGYVLTSDGSGNVAWEAQTGGVPDGDKGDITVSAGGSTWTIENGAVAGEKIANNQVGLGKLEQINTDTLLGRDAAGVGSVTTISVGGGIEFTGSHGIQIANDAVTYAKLQNVSATSRVLGRKGAGAGDAEECTLSEILDFVGSAAQGDILYRGASGWERLGAGTSGRFLRTNGSAANPSWNAAPVETAVITSNYTDSTGTLGNVTGMSFSLAANERVTAILSGFWGTQTTNSGFRYDITGPSSPTFVLYNVAHGTTQTAFRSGDGATAFSTAFVEVTGNAALYLPVTIHLHVVNGANAGTVQLRMGGETNGVTFTLYQGFTLQLFRF